MKDKLSALIFNVRDLLLRLEAIKEKINKLTMKDDLEQKIDRCKKPLTTFYNDVKKIEDSINEIEETI